MIRVVILGAGNVASNLYPELKDQKNITIVQCYNRKGIALHPGLYSCNLVVTDIRDLAKADLYILAVSDDAIEEMSAQIPKGNHLVVHTSGSVPMDTIADQHRKGVFYPLQTFSKNKNVDFNSVPFCIEAENPEDLKTLKQIASSLSEKVYEISSKQRNILHVAAVFVNNFTNYMFSAGNDICDKHQVPFEILHPLILETAQKATSINPDKAQTGPAIRKDNKTIKRHQDILSDPTYIEIYQTLTKAIQSKYGKKL